jgi:hypothetical protein
VLEITNYAFQIELDFAYAYSIFDILE